MIHGGFEIKDGLLNIGGKVDEVKDLRDPGASDASDACNLGLVFDLTSCKEIFQANCQCHELGDVRDAFRRSRGYFGAGAATRWRPCESEVV